VRAADALGFPVVLKLESIDVPHKSDAGVVQLNLRTPAQVRLRTPPSCGAPPPAAGAAHRRRAGAAHAAARRGIWSARTAIRCSGPLLLVGLGGVFWELLEGHGHGQAPLSLQQALAMLQSQGFPGLRRIRARRRCRWSAWRK